MRKIRKFISKFISVPILVYIVILLYALFCLKRSIDCQDNTIVIISNFYWNMFFAVIGSFFVSLLIDVGTTRRIEERKKQAFILFKERMTKILNSVGQVSGILQESLRFDENGFITSKSGFSNGNFYYNHIVEERPKNKKNYYRVSSKCLLNAINIFKTDIKDMMNVKSYEWVDDEIKYIFESIYLCDCGSLEGALQDEFSHICYGEIEAQIKELYKLYCCLCTYLNSNIYKTITMDCDAEVKAYNEKLEEWIKNRSTGVCAEFKYDAEWSNDLTDAFFLLDILG